MSSVTINDLAFSYEDSPSPALTGINLRFSAGEFVLLTGATGAGKSTLCYCINGLIPNSIRGKYSGEVLIDELRVGETEVKDICIRVGSVFQDPESQILTTTVEEEVAFGPENLGVKPVEIQERVAFALGAVGLQDMRDRFPYALSGGQKQRLAIATALAMLPQVLVLDEPTAQLDPKGTEEVFSVVKDLNKRYGKTIIIAEHKLDDLLRFVDRMVVLSHGRIVAAGKPQEILRKPEVRDNRNLRMPQLASLFNLIPKLSSYPIPLTVESAVTSVEKALGSRRHNVRFREQEVKLAESETAVSMLDVSFRYPNGVAALKGISLEIGRGQYVALIGQNGSGKTTLAKHMNGLLRPSSGVVLVFRLDTKQTSVGELAGHVGYAFQNPDHQIFLDKVFDEVAYAPRRVRKRHDVDEIVHRSLELVGLQGRDQDFTFTLGLSERRRLTIASVLAMQPEVVILDEPTAGLDHEETLSVMNVTKKLQREGKTVIIVSHDIPVVAEYAERIVALYDGQILLDGPTREVLTQVELLDRTYVKPPPITQLFIQLAEQGFPTDVHTLGEAQTILSHALSEYP
jgi:energy-coupling factor transport system ATP-binding protein